MQGGQQQEKLISTSVLCVCAVALGSHWCKTDVFCSFCVAYDHLEVASVPCLFQTRMLSEAANRQKH